MTGKLVALGGRMHSGKTTASKLFTQSGDWQRIRFAGAFKALAHRFLVLSGYGRELASECVDGSMKNTPLPDIDMSMRRLMQNIGSSFREKLGDPDFWGNIAISRARHLMKSNINVLIDDMRFRHEDDVVHANGGYTVLIEGNHSQESHRSDINVLDGIYSRAGVMTDDVFRRNIVQAWDETVGQLKLHNARHIRDVFIDFVNTVLIPSRGHVPVSDLMSHASEHSLPEVFDYRIVNNGSIADLKEKVENFVILLGEGRIHHAKKQSPSPAA